MTPLAVSVMEEAMNEAQVRRGLIDPALKAAGWDAAPAKVAAEQTIAPGSVSQEDGRSHNLQHWLFAA